MGGEEMWVLRQFSPVKVFYSIYPLAFECQLFDFIASFSREKYEDFTSLPSQKNSLLNLFLNENHYSGEFFFSRRFSSEKTPTVTVARCFSFFFVRLQSHSDWATFLTVETTKATTIRPSPVSGN